MSAPANDNIANAATIAGLSGSVSSNNNNATLETVGATHEPGWPSYNTAAVYPRANTEIGPFTTVWYVWSCPAFPAPTGSIGPYDVPPTAEVLFTTDDVATDFSTVLQIYNPLGGTVTIASIREITPNFDGNGNLESTGLILDERVGVNNGMGNGASISIVAQTGNTYYIRIGGRNSAQGNFKLSWKLFDRPTLGSCTSCQPTCNGNQVGIIQLPNLGSSHNINFPTVGAGLFQISWCKGVFIWGQGEPYWALGSGNPNPTFAFIWPEGNWGPPDGNFNSQTEAEIGNECVTSGLFISCGGTFRMQFGDGFYTDNIPGSALPAFELIQLDNSQLLSIFKASVDSSTVLTNTGVNSWSCNFGISYINPNVPPAITATLLNMDGITGASAPVSISFGAGPTTSFPTFTFNANLGGGFCTAVIQLSVCGTVIGTLEYPLYPTIVLSGSGTTTGSCLSLTGPPFTTIGISFNQFLNCKITSPIVSFADLGISSVTLTGTSSPLSLINPTALGCPVLTPNQVVNTVGLGTTVNALRLPVLEPGSTTNNTFTVAITCASLSYPNFTITDAVP